MLALTIDPEFRAIIPELTADERGRLAVSIKADGCRDPLVIWKGHGLLLDGHNRYDICKSARLPFATTEIDLPDRDACKLWIIRNQLARRNLTDAMRVKLALAAKEPLAKQAKERQKEHANTAPGKKKNTCGNVATSDAGEKVRDQIASMAGVSGRTVDKVEAVIESGDEETLGKMLAGGMKINTAYETVKGKKEKVTHFQKRQRQLNAVGRKMQQEASELLKAERRMSQSFEAAYGAFRKEILGAIDDGYGRTTRAAVVACLIFLMELVEGETE